MSCLSKLSFKLKGIDMEIEKIFKTSDLAIAAFLMMKGKKLLEASVEKGGKFNFYFEDKENICSQYVIDFANSESAKFDSHVKNLKNILFKS
jgi:hypothetical protein